MFSLTINLFILFIYLFIIKVTYLECYKVQIKNCKTTNFLKGAGVDVNFLSIFSRGVFGSLTVRREGIKQLP